MYYYKIFGLHIDSELPLPGLCSAEPAHTTDVVIKRGSLRPPPPDAVCNGRYATGTDNTAHLFWKHIGSFFIREGKEVIVDPAPKASASSLASFLSGVVMGLLLHQRGYYILHASAVSMPEGVIAFVGFKGAGKSTLAAALHARGFPLFTDDVLAVELRDAAPPIVEPGLCQFKLWPEAVTASLGENPDTLPRLHPDVNKRIKWVSSEVGQQASSLKHIYILDVDSELAIGRAQGQEAFINLARNAYAPRFIGREGFTATQFEQCTRLAQIVPTFRLNREWDLTKLAEVVDLVESHSTTEAPQST